MLKYKGLLVSFVLISSFGWAQPSLEVQGNGTAMYLVHTVVAGNNWYSVGRLYNINPKALPTINNTVITKPLIIGQSLKIPLSNINFSQNGVIAKDEVLVPLYYVVKEKEWMYRISQNHNKVPVATLEKWNNIKNDQVKPGMKLTVGFLKVKTGQSALAAQGSKKIVPATPEMIAQNAPVVEEKAVEEQKTADIAQKEESNKQAQDNTKTAIKEVPKVQAEEQKVKEEPKVQHEEVKTQHPETETGISAPNTNTNTSIATYKGGYFKTLYASSGKDQMGNAGVFKSTSGWKDGKYYALMNNVPVGTIVKVTFSSTNKSVFAKVLGQLPEMRESTGLLVRLSDAAASELGADNGKFYVDVKY